MPFSPAPVSSVLNPEQSAAIRYLDGPLLVLAGAGSGKTRVITHKIAHLIEQGIVPAARIAAITFTNKAASEMRQRIGALLAGKPARGLTVSTFHALGMEIMRRDGSALGYKPRFSVIDAADAQQILSEILAQPEKSELYRVQNRISLWKNALIDPDTAAQQAEDAPSAAAARAYRQYQQTLHAYQALDFDDLIRLPVELFREQPEILEKWRQRIAYLLIDEYQDTNGCQYALVKALAGLRGNFTAVGDDDQAIYAWRGASAENLAALRDDFSELKVIKLEQNYRSTVRILRAANSLIDNNPKLFEKKLWSELGHGDVISIIEAQNDEHEAESVIMRMLAHKFEHRTRFGDYAILYRGNHQARAFEQALRNEKIPYRVSGGTSFFERAEIRDITAYLRLLINPDDDLAFIRALTAPKRGIGNETLEKLGKYAATQRKSLYDAVFDPGIELYLPAKPYAALRQFCDYMNALAFRAEREPVATLARELVQAIGYEAWLYDNGEPRQAETKWNNVVEFLDWIEKKSGDGERSLAEVTQLLAIMNMLENRDDDSDAVRLSTIHAAKGLEYGHVFVVGVEEGTLPHRECVENGQIAEERRLMYVAITRAKKSLSLSYCLKRKRGKEWVSCEPSRFIAELVQEDLRFSGRRAEPEQNKTEGTARLAQLKAMLKKE